MSIHIEKGNVFFNNVNSVESIYDFLVVQQNYTEKMLEFTFSADYKFYVSEYLMAIKNTNNDKYDMLTNKISTFLFYNSNGYLNRRGEPMQKVKHTIISEDGYGLLELQKKDWSYFIEKLLEISEKEKFELENEGSE